MKLNQKGFGVVEGLLIVVVVALIAGVGFYVVNANKDDKKTANETTDTSTTETPKQTEPEPTQEPAKPQKSDKELIIAAVKQYMVKQGATQAEVDSQIKVSVDEVVGNNARGNTNDGGTGAGYIAHKENNTWKIVYMGQSGAGKAIGEKYNLPSGWYSTAF